MLFALGSRTQASLHQDRPYALLAEQYSHDEVLTTICGLFSMHPRLVRRLPFCFGHLQLQWPKEPMHRHHLPSGSSLPCKQLRRLQSEL
jgi:hypothetical protein